MRFLSVSLALALVPWLAQAAPPDTPEAKRPSFHNLRYMEDWSVLRDGARPESFLDPIKYIPFDEEGRFWLSLGGHARGRIEMWNNFLFGASFPEDSDTFYLHRLFLHADLHLTEYVRIFAEFKNVLASDRQLLGGKRFSDVDDADLQNLFGELRLPLGDVLLGARGGRQEIQFGAQRLVSPLDWANARRIFEGAVAYGQGEGWNVTGFWARPVFVKRYDFNESIPVLQFFGVYSNVDLPGDDLGLDLYWLALMFDAIRLANRAPGEGIRHTLGGRVFGAIPGTPLRVDLEGAAQLGNVESADILAGMFSAKLTWPFASAPLEPAVYVGYDWASGDSGSSGSVGTFDQLFPLGHAFLGYIDAVARQNIQAVQLGGKFSPLPEGVVALTWHAFWLDDVNDALYAASGAPIRLDPTASSKHVGVEMDLTFKYRFARGLDALVGYSHFFRGRFLADSGPEKDVDFGYLQLQYTF